MSEYKKKLIEVALPLDVINAASKREKGIRSGHPSTLHLWWARRPLSACRAVLFAQLVDDPSSRPDEFPTEQEQDIERQRLFAIIEDLVKWESTTDEVVLERARAEIRRSCGGEGPPILDPFAGGGSIPLEAQRLGLDAYAQDLNPVSVLINRAMIELPPKFAGMPPKNPEPKNQTRWSGAEGLAEDVQHYGEWIEGAARERVGQMYPTVRLDDGSQATVISWLWTRTVESPDPAWKGHVPIANSFKICTKKGKEAWVVPEPDHKTHTVHYRVATSGEPPPEGTIGRGGGRCIVTGAALPLKYARAEGKAGRIGSALMAIVAQGPKGRVYLSASQLHVDAAQVDASDAWAPNQALAINPRAITAPNYGFESFADLHTDRQLVMLNTFSDLVAEAREKCFDDCGDSEYADAIATYLTLGLGRLLNRSSSQCFWDPAGEGIMQVFARNALPMVWVFAEGNPFSSSSGNYLGQLDYLVKALKNVPARGSGRAAHGDAAALNMPVGAVVSSDPPYYDNVPYADLSDFFYVWFRKIAVGLDSQLFSTMLVPKVQELIAEPARHSSWDEASDFFEDGLRSVFGRIADQSNPEFPITLFYAFKQSEENRDDGAIASTGWDTFLTGLLDSGFAITATWPVRTEQAGGLRVVGRNALASSIVLACRHRDLDASVIDRQGFLRKLRQDLPLAVSQLTKASIAPVDLRQAAIGPGIKTFSEFARVVEDDNEAMTVRSALILINQVLSETLDAADGNVDSDTQFALRWFSQFGYGEGAFGEAEVLAVAMNVSVEGIIDAGIAVGRPGLLRLLSLEELDEDWDPSRDTRLPLWEITVRLAATLASDGEAATARLARQIERSGRSWEQAQALSYRIYAASEQRNPQAGAPFNALAASWPEIVRLANQNLEPIQVAEQQSFDA